MDKDVAGPSKNCPADVIFVVDKSRTVGSGNFALLKSFLSRFVSKLDIDSGNTRFGVVPYSIFIYAREAFNLSTHTSIASVQSAIESLTRRRWFGFTFTHRALRYVRTTMLTSAAGDRSDVLNVVVVLTDGKSTYAAGTEVCTVTKPCFPHVLTNCVEIVLSLICQR